MLDKHIIGQLATIVGNSYVLMSPEDLETYSYDSTAPSFDRRPEAVVVPSSTEEVAAILRLANENGFSVIPRGSGTNLSGGTIPSPGSVVMPLTRLNRVLEIDQDNLLAIVEPAVITMDFQTKVEKLGLFYPPDPASNKISTIGGNVAENSGGLRGLKYGVTKNYIMGLEVVFPSGEIGWTGGKCAKDVAGYNLTQLFVGSEGTLGVFTKIMLKLLPKPEAVKTMLAVYDRLVDAASSVSAIIASKMLPSTLEIMDQTTNRCVENYYHLGLPTDADAILLIEVDGPPLVIEGEAARAAEICRANGARTVQVAATTAEGDSLKAGRRGVIPAMAALGPTVIMEDATVPRSKIVPMCEAIRRIAREKELTIAIFGHAGDGNLHPLCVTDERNKDELKRVEAAFREIFDVAISLEGTITGEHGIGLKKRTYLPKLISPPSLAAMKTLKAALDPNNVLNPGKIFLAEGEEVRPGQLWPVSSAAVSKMPV